MTEKATKKAAPKKAAKPAAPEIPLYLTNPRAHRESLNLNQSNYWSRFGVTQSGGSRYESGRQMPRPVIRLLHIAFGSPAECEAAVQELRSGAE